MPDSQAATLSFDVRSGVLHAGLFALAYFVGAELAYAVSLGPSVGGTFWPPAGIALAALLVAPRRSWPQLLVAGAIANFMSDQVHGQTLSASVAFAVANLSEPLIGALLLRRMFPAPVTLTRLPEIVALAFVAVLVSAPFAAAIGATAAEWWTPDAPGFLAGWRTWWVGDAVGALVLTPAVVRVITDWRQAGAVPARRWIEAAAFSIVVFAVTQIVFAVPPPAIAMPFLVFPVLLWGSLRFGPIGVGGALCLVVLLTAVDTAAGQGPFAADELSLGDRLIALQVYVGVMALTFHGLGVLWEERSRTAAALKSAHSGLSARYRRIVEQSPLGILALQHDGRVKEVNPAWQRLWLPAGGEEPDPGSQPWEDAQLGPLLRRAFTGEIVALPERSVAVPGGGRAQERRLRGVAYPVKDEAGNVAEVVLIERDITDEVEARQQIVEANRALREREEALSHLLEEMAEAQAHREQLLEAERFARGEAERASQLKEEFLATLSHELRSPLNAIIGWTHVLRQSSKGSEFEPAVETIERNAVAQAKLIDDLLDMSRIMAGKVGLTLARANPAEIVAAAADALRPVAEAKGLSLSVNVANAGNVSLTCDAARLQQVVTNLLGNGIKFTPAGGRVEVLVVAGEQEVRIIVRDTGQGIPTEFLPAVFERFRQADGSITRHHGGLGLGLSIARQIVDMHGGTITAHSDGPDQGATFTVTLPLAGEVSAREPAAGDEPQAVSLTGLRVLVVDDEVDARELLRRLLVEQGCHVSIAGSAQEALALLAADSCDVLLTDIGMPGTDGYELLRSVRATDNAPKAIAVTAFARREDRDRALAAGFDGHLAKPVNPVRLLQMLAQVSAPWRAAGARA
ncbi:MAG TPA: MASE1 domain-containing protein [Woeseiaceae bacterium]|nr:MASE1 domain-containing protein [Woeseiaceae bacterium]